MVTITRTVPNVGDANKENNANIVEPPFVIILLPKYKL